MPDRRRDLGPFYADVIAVDPLDPSGAASAAYRLRTLAPALPFPVEGARLVPSNNNDVWRLDAGYLRVSWRGDRSRLAREAVLFSAIKDAVPVPRILDYGGDSRLAWSLSAPVPGGPLEDLCTRPAPAGLRDLAREAAGLLRTLHSLPVPDEFAAMLSRTEEDPLRRAGSEFVLLPPSEALGLVPVIAGLPFVDRGVLEAAAGRLRDLEEPEETGGDVLLHGDFYPCNVLVHDGHVSALIDFEFARTGPRDLELITAVRALDAESRLGIARPPLLAWLAEDYPELFTVPDPERRMWRYAIAYTLSHILYWPPDRAETDGLDATHPVHTLRRLVDAPLPFPAGRPARARMRPAPEPGRGDRA